MKQLSEKEYFEKITKGEELSERELKDLVFDFEYDCQEGDMDRWTISVKTIVELCGEYFAIDWERALTEMQEHEFYNQPYKVEKVEKMVKVTEWVEKENSDE